MKFFLIVSYIALTFSAPSKSFASEVEAGSPASILDSKEDDFCIKASQTDGGMSHYHDCLNNALSKSNKKLTEKYEEKLKEITYSKDYDFYDSINSDRKSLRPKIEASYKNEQKTWIIYRESYCKNIVSGNITGDSAFVGYISCTINMNKRRVEEINLMYNPASTW
ncbi:hypothetical protein PMPD1_2171 [Paramixta manurensis]|uniref:Lysozyme inhibitor LprI-like N-terminal domain-containing protein n=1 Tax=Paramixta manurensis TaxID=2740817 RepID=A0A6M8UF83_9GAMM|nr:hypothetical protein PMPD1_2171 [Erwiniaceae bacterium PD-1]